MTPTDPIKPEDIEWRKLVGKDQEVTHGFSPVTGANTGDMRSGWCEDTLMVVPSKVSDDAEGPKCLKCTDGLNLYFDNQRRGSPVFRNSGGARP